MYWPTPKLWYPTICDKAVVSGLVGYLLWRGADGWAAVEFWLMDWWTEALIGDTVALVRTEANSG